MIYKVEFKTGEAVTLEARNKRELSSKINSLQIDAFLNGEAVDFSNPTITELKTATEQKTATPGELFNAMAEKAIAELRETGKYPRSVFDFDFCPKINNISIWINHIYRVSVGLCDDKIEVFRCYVGAEVDEEGFYITDGERHQYRLFNSVKPALNYALRCAVSDSWDKPIEIW